jgi:hypothetical protein
MQRGKLRFEECLSSPATKKLYQYYLKKFCQWATINYPEQLLTLKDSFLQILLEDYLFLLKKTMNPNSIPPIFAALELFLSINDKTVNAKKLHKTLSLVVTEDMNLTKIRNMTMSHLEIRSSAFTPSANWSGYEVAGSGFTYPSLPTAPVYEAAAEFYVPQISRPSIPANACDSIINNECHYSIWSGLVRNWGGMPVSPDNFGRIAQGGIDGVIHDCHTSCITSYYAWTEFFPANQVPCSSLTILPNDDVLSDVYSEIIIGGSLSNYDIAVTDYRQNSGTMCLIPQNYPQLNTPLLGDFIVERASVNSNPATLPVFNTNPSIIGTMTYNDTQTTIFPSYTYGEYVEHGMWNPTTGSQAVMNMDNSIVDSTGTFTTRYDSSANTCSPAPFNLWTVTSSCVLGSNTIPHGNVEISNNSLLTIANGVKLIFPLQYNKILVDSGSGILIQSGGSIAPK